MKRIVLVFATLLAGCLPRDDASGFTELVKIEAGHENEWLALTKTVSNPKAPFTANITFTKKHFSSVDELIANLPADYPGTFIFVADAQTFKDPEFVCVVVDLIDPARPRFRAIAVQLPSIENNLNLGNMDFAEFAEAAKPTGVFRGF